MKPESPTPNPDSIKVEPRGETIDFDSLKPLNDPNCQHVWQREAEADIPGTYTEICTKCPVGRIVRA